MKIKQELREQNEATNEALKKKKYNNKTYKLGSKLLKANRKIETL